MKVKAMILRSGVSLDGREVHPSVITDLEKTCKGKPINVNFDSNMVVGKILNGKSIKVGDGFGLEITVSLNKKKCKAFGVDFNKQMLAAQYMLSYVSTGAGFCDKPAFKGAYVKPLRKKKRTK